MFSRITVALIALLLAAQNVNAQQAEFIAKSPTKGCFPLEVEFQDTSTGTVTDRSWNFGNSKSSTAANPKTIYTEPGVYDVTLTVSNNGGAPNTITHVGFVTVYGYPEVDFSFDKSSGCSPLAVKFRDETSPASGAIDKWTWVFGDGGSSSSANPNYTFTTPGNYSVSLQIRNEFGCEKTLISPTQVNVLGPKTKFISDKQAVCTLPATFQFTNQTGGNNTYQWDFGDGLTSTSVSPSHTYNLAGTHNVTLKARDGNGCEHSSKISVSVGSEGGLTLKPIKDKVCVGDNIKFDFESADAPVWVEWNFGDGDTSSENDPERPYAQPGNYTVTLTAQLLNRSCPSVIKKQILVATPAVPSFTYSNDCNYELTLTSTSTNATRIEWYIEDLDMMTGTQVKSPLKRPGNQDIRMVAYDAAGCTVEKDFSAYVPPNPNAAFEPDVFQTCDPNKPQLAGCAPFTVNFKDKSTSNDPFTISWDFGDGQTSTQSNPTHVFGKGFFQVRLTATNSKGCKGVLTQFVNVADQAPKAEFTIDRSQACEGDLITFTNKSTNADYWCWDFGDGSIGSGKDATHQYGMPGLYSVKLIARNAGCIDVFEIPNAIRIVNPHIDFEPKKICTSPHDVTLMNNSFNFDELSWDFGDGQSSNNVNPGTHHYPDEGTYVVKLTGKNNTTGCVVTDEATIIIQNVKADFAVNTDVFDPNTIRVCANGPLVFTDKSRHAVTWEWKIAGQEFGTEDVSTKVKTPGDNYTALLTVTDSDLCTDTKIVPMIVMNLKGDFSFDASSTCDEFNVDFKSNSGTTGNPTGWHWDFGDGETADEENPSHAYSSRGVFNVSLTVTNNDGSCPFIKESAITFTIPEPSFTTSKPEFCSNDFIQVANTSRNATMFEWDYGDGRRSDARAPSISYEHTGKYDLTLFASDVYGCERKVVQEAFIVIKKPTADFSLQNSTAACPPLLATFTDESLGNIKSYDWDSGMGEFSDDVNPKFVYNKPGKFNVKLTVTDNDGCTDTKIANQFVTVDGPTGNFAATGDSQCTNEPIIFNANVVDTNILRWDFGDGVVVDGGTEISHQYTSYGDFTPSLILIDNKGCQTVADGTDVLQIQDTTAVAMSIGPACIKTDEKFIVTGTSELPDDIISWSWTVDGVDHGTGASFEGTLDQPGLHLVTTRAVNKFNCVSNATDTVRIQGPVTTIPNVITPDGDTKNQTFMIPGLEYSKWNIDIMNRWGTSVYQKFDYKGDWDGENQPAGVYYYILRNAHCEDRNYKGFVSIVR